MAGSPHPMLQTVRTFWRAVTGQEPATGSPASPAVILHDPGGQGPHNLDDPYFDPKVQTRIAEVIANSRKDP